MTVAKRLEEIEELIAKGDIAKASAMIKNIHKRFKIPFNRLAQFGQLANRCGEFTTCIGALYKQAVKEDDHHEIIKEYATALNFLGCRHQAANLAQYLIDNKQKDALFLRALCSFRSWQYDHAVMCLKQYIQLDHLSAYKIKVGELNLAYALNCLGDNLEAKDLLEKILASSEAKNSKRMELNARLILTQVHYGLEDWKSLKKSLESLGKEKKLISPEEAASLHKWQILYDFHQGGDLNNLQAQLQSFSAECVQNKFYEIARSCDFYLGKFTQDQAIIEKNYFGSPFSGYRKSIEEFYPQINQVKNYKYNPGRGAVLDKFKEVDLFTGEIDGARGFDPTNKIFLFLRGIFSDYYRPLSVYELFEYIFPDEIFIPNSSTLKLSATGNRLNSFCEANKIELSVYSRKQNFYFSAENSLMLKSYKQYPRTEDEQIWQNISDLGEDGFFKSKEFVTVLNIGQKKGLNLLKKYIEDEKIEKIGKGSNTRYRIINNDKKAA